MSENPISLHSMIRVKVGYDRYFLLPSTLDNMVLASQLAEQPLFTTHYNADFSERSYCMIDDDLVQVEIGKTPLDSRTYKEISTAVRAERQALEAARTQCSPDGGTDRLAVAAQ